MNKQNNLPINKIKSEFESAIAEKPLIVVAPTGSGKSTQIPSWCAKSSDKPVLVVEPRRVACRSLARWVAEQHGEKLGNSVGYTIRFEDVTTKNTRIRFVTPGVALRYASGKELDHYDTIILDEFHERVLETDLFLAICREKYPDKKLVIMSATIAAQQLANFLDGNVLHAEGRVHPVDVEYLGGQVVPTSRDLVTRIENGLNSALSETEGNVLIFLPGKGEINACNEAFRSRQDIQIVPLHGDLPATEQDRAFESKQRLRRVILTTNVAETSVTLPGITAVVDSGLVRQRIHQNRRVVLALCPISKASAEQRRGRAGRLGPGKCYRLWEEHGQLEFETLPEIRREDLTQFVLTVASTGYRPQDLVFLDPPPDFAVERAQNDLKSWGIVSDDSLLTDFGSKICSLPVNVLYARLLVKAPSNLRRDLIDLVASLERTTSLWGRMHRLLSDKQKEIMEARKKDLFRGGCDATTAILTLRCGDVNRHYLHKSTLTECRKVATQLREFFELPPITEDTESTYPDRPALITYLLKEWEMCGYIRSRKGKGWRNGQEEVLLDSDSLVADERHAALILQTIGIARGTGFQLMGRTAMPCTFEKLVDAGIGTTDLTTPKLEGKDIVAEVVTSYAGREIGRTRQPLHGSMLREAMTTLILSGKLFPGLGKKLAETVRVWELYLILQENRNTSTDEKLTPSSWLISRLEELGVEQAEDKDLLSVNDFIFKDIDAETIKELQSKYPQEYSILGAKFTVEYFPKEKRILLKRIGGVRQPTLSSMLLPRWNDWTVQIDMRGQVRTLRA